MQVPRAIIDQRERHGSKRPLGRGDGIRLAHVDLDRLPQSTRQGLVAALDDMVIVRPIQIFDMQRDASAGCKAMKPVLDKLGIPFAQTRHRQRNLPHKIRPPRNIECAARQSLVHRRVGAAITRDPAFIAERLQNRFADRNAGVFGGVMLVDMQVANRLHLQIDERMPRQLLKHMVEKANAGRNLVHAAAVEIDFDIDRRFVGLAADRPGTHGRRYTHASTFGNNIHLDLAGFTVHQAPMSEDHADSLIPYDDVVQEALRAVVGRVLGDVAAGGLPGNHHFYITFKTQAPGVVIPTHLHERFPDEMTIVVQHKYWDLKVEAAHFEIGLSFSQIPLHLVVPYSAITAFVDPSVDFALQFHVDAASDGPEPHEVAGNDEPAVIKEDGSNVVSVDFGRKK